MLKDVSFEDDVNRVYKFHVHYKINVVNDLQDAHGRNKITARHAMAALNTD